VKWLILESPRYKIYLVKRRVWIAEYLCFRATRGVYACFKRDSNGGYIPVPQSALNVNGSVKVVKLANSVPLFPEVIFDRD